MNFSLDGGLEASGPAHPDKARHSAAAQLSRAQQLSRPALLRPCQSLWNRGQQPALRRPQRRLCRAARLASASPWCRRDSAASCLCGREPRLPPVPAALPAPLQVQVRGTLRLPSGDVNLVATQLTLDRWAGGRGRWIGSGGTVVARAMEWDL